MDGTNWKESREKPKKNVKEINSMCFIQKNDIIHLVNLQQFNIKD